jgi:hypothetical protein
MAKRADGNEPEADARYERKFLISELNADEVESLVKLNPAMFSELYAPRFVNSLYLDTLDLQSYFANVDGLSERTKIRIRWYGELLGRVEQPVLELKIKKNALGRKESYPLAPFSLDQHFSLKSVHDVFQTSSLPPMLAADLLSLESAMIVRYRRKYFQSSCRRYRITVDRDLVFYRLEAGNSFLHKSYDGLHTILELKYDRNQGRDVHHVAGYFPFRLTKVSKYVLGVERLNVW